MDLEEKLQDVPVGGPLRIEDDLDRLSVTRMVARGRVVVRPAGVADTGGDDPVAVAWQFLRRPETAPGQDRGLGVLGQRGPSPEVVLTFIAEGLPAWPDRRTTMPGWKPLVTGTRPGRRSLSHARRNPAAGNVPRWRTEAGPSTPQTLTADRVLPVRSSTVSRFGARSCLGCAG